MRSLERVERVGERPVSDAPGEDAVARFFDATAAAADALEPWYEHLDARFRSILDAAVPAARRGARALDAGCGTGAHVAMLAARGYRVHGLDLSAESLRLARARAPEAALARGDLCALPYAGARFDLVICAGSALDFVRDAPRALRDLGRVMRPGARLVLEYERRWCLDTGWAVASGFVGDPLGYGLDRAGARRLLRRPWGEGIWIDYPGYPRLRLFADVEIDRALRRSGLAVERAWGIHAITNLVPSTVLHRPRLPWALRPLYGVLRSADALAGRLRAVAAHGVVLARRA